MMHNLLLRKLVEVGPNEAEKYLSINTYEAQRPLNDHHVDFLATAMKEDRFHTGSIAVAKCIYNGNKPVMLNGQHQCTAVKYTGKKVVAIYQEFTAKSPEELSKLYRQFDCPIGTRTQGQYFHAECIAFGLKLVPRIETVIHGGIKAKERLINVYTQDKIAVLGKYLEIVDFINSILCEDGKVHREVRHMLRGPVAHAMILTFQKDPEEAIVFWTNIRDGEDLKKSMPEYVLRLYLQTVNVLGGRGANGARVATPTEMTAKCIHAWNAWRRNESTRLTFKGSIPKVV